MKWLIKKWWLILLIVIVGFVIYWNWFRARANNLESYTVSQGDLTSNLVLSGEIAAKEHAIVRFQSSGMLSWVGVKIGDQVKKGQSLASLDRRALQKSLEQKLNSYMATRWNFEQTASDNKDWNVRGMSDAEREGIKRIVEKSQFALNNSVLDVELTDLSYQLAMISSPIQGVVVSAIPEFSGFNVTPTTSSYEIINPETWYFSVSADQTEVVDLQNGQEVSITIDAFPENDYSGKIEWISLSPDQTQTGTVYLMRVVSDQLAKQSGIRIGMTGDATFVTGERQNVQIIPAKYYRQDTDGIYVLVDQGKQKKYIELGLEAGDQVEVINGLNTGDVIYLPQ